MTFAPKLESVTNTGLREYGGPSEQAELWKGLEDVMVSGTKVATDFINKGIEGDARKLFEEANADFTAALPSEFKSTENKMAVLQQAFEQGKISQTGYYMQLAAGAKALKAKYPGFANEADAAIQRVTGVNPANAFRNSLMSDIESHNKSVQKEYDHRRSFLEQNQDVVGTRYPDLAQNMEAYIADDEKFKKVQSDIFQRQAQISEVSQEKALLEVRKARGEDTRESYKQLYNTEAVRIATSLTYGLRGQVAQEFGFKDISELAKAAANGDLSPQQMSDLSNMLKFGRAEGVRSIQAYAVAGSNGVISAEEAAKIGESALGPMIDPLIDALGTKDWTAVNAMDKMLEVQISREKAAVINDAPALHAVAVWSSINKEGASWVMQKYFADNNEKLEALMGRVAVISEQTRSQSFEEILRNKGMSQQEKASAFKEAIKTDTGMLADPVLLSRDKELWIRQARKVFDDPGEFLSKFAPKDRRSAFLQYTTPYVTNNVVQSGDKELLQKYSTWAVNHSMSTPGVKNLIKDVQNISYVRDMVRPDMGEDGKIKLVVDPDKMDTFLNVSGTAKIARIAEIRNALDAINGYNEVMTNMGPIITANGGNVAEKSVGLLTMASVDLNAERHSIVGWLTATLGMPDAPEVPGMKEKTDVEMTLSDWVAKHPEVLRFSPAPDVVRPTQKDSGVLDEKQRALRDAISASEGTADEGGYGRLLGGAEKRFNVDITNMTIDELSDFSRGAYAQFSERQLGYRATPMGKYQIVGDTLRMLKKKMGLSGSEKFTQELQDRMFKELLGENPNLSSIEGTWEGVQRNLKGARGKVMKILG